MGNMSAAELNELEALEKELARAAQEIDQYVASLSPEEQEQFHQAVKEVESMLENMSEDEFNQMLNQMFQEENQASITQPEVLTPVKVAEPVTIKSTLTADEARKQETALQLLENLINRTNSFIVKTQSILEIPGSIDRWALQGKIAHWPSGVSWSGFEKQIEMLNQRFYLLMDKDETTNKFRYLLDLIADEKTFTALFDLEKKLTQNESLIELPALGSTKMNITTKNALKNVTAAYSTAFYGQDIIKSIDSIIEKYGPIAKKLKDDEAQRAERAKQESEKPGQIGRTAIAGKQGNTDMGGNFGSAQDFGGGYSSYPGGYYGGYNPGYYGGSDTGAPEGRVDTRNGGKKNIESSDKSSATKDTKDTSIKKDAKKKDTEKNSVDRLIGQIEESFNSIQALFNEYPILANIKEHCTTFGDADPMLAGFAITALDKRIHTLTSQIKSLDKQITSLTKEEQNTQKTEVNKIFKSHRDGIEQLKQELASLESNWQQTRKSISPEKLYAYFQEQIQEAPSKQVLINNTDDKTLEKETLSKKTDITQEVSAEIINHIVKHDEYMQKKNILEDQINNNPKDIDLAAIKKQLAALQTEYAGYTEPLPHRRIIDVVPVVETKSVPVQRPSRNPDEPDVFAPQTSNALTPQSPQRLQTDDSETDQKSVPQETSQQENPNKDMSLSLKNTVQSAKSLFDVLDSINKLYTALGHLNIK